MSTESGHEEQHDGVQAFTTSALVASPRSREHTGELIAAEDLFAQAAARGNAYAMIRCAAFRSERDDFTGGAPLLIAAAAAGEKRAAFVLFAMFNDPSGDSITQSDRALVAVRAGRRAEGDEMFQRWKEIALGDRWPMRGSQNAELLDAYNTDPLAEALRRFGPSRLTR